jgi:hypothetical protein
MIETPAIRTTRTRYPEQAKALAYELYAHRCNGDMPETIKLLNELVTVPVSEKSVYAWRAEFQWDRRRQAESEALAPLSWDLYFGGLSVAAPESVSYLRSVIADESESTRNRIAAARAILSQVAQHVEQLEARLPAPPDPPVVCHRTNEELLLLEETPGYEG